MKNIFIVFCILTLFLFISCKDKQQDKPPIPQVPLQQMPEKQMSSDTPMMNPHGNIKKTEKRIELPDSVRMKWTKAVIVVEDLKNKTRYEQTVNIGSEFTLKNSNIVVRTREFIPDFRMTDTTITTASNELNNPALRIEVYEGDKDIFKGWLYMKFPDIHPFEHERYSIKLKNVI
ncbi:MAG: DUF2155 domain-containing protein [Thermodesulfovibrionales bacterium]|nr:DUF2155 domain-containing protein [Thermodesulfovibrionales bacterium]